MTSTDFDIPQRHAEAPLHCNDYQAPCFATALDTGSIQDDKKMPQQVREHSWGATGRKGADMTNVTARMRYEVLRRDGFRCRACGMAPSEDPVVLHVDHVVPVALGGSSSPSNLQTLCATCNFGKGSSVPGTDEVESVADAVDADREAVESYGDYLAAIEEKFRALWSQHAPRMALDDEVASTVDQLILAGASWSLIERGIVITGQAWSPGRARPMGYFLGVMRKLIDTGRSGARWWA